MLKHIKKTNIPLVKVIEDKRTNTSFKKLKQPFSTKLIDFSRYQEDFVEFLEIKLGYIDQSPSHFENYFLQIQIHHKI